MMNPSPVTAHAAARDRVRLQGVSPLQWWRGAPTVPELSDEHAIAALRSALDRVAVLGLAERRAAAAGNEIAAVGIALRLATRPETPPWLLDWAASALLLYALEGSHTAGVVLAHLRRRHGMAGTASGRRL